jgi:protein TonB
MNGYKTGGNWSDVTSIDRNEVVFEGRHKAYGAFYIRKRYPKALLFAFLSALTFFAVCAYVPYALRNISPPIVKSDKDIIIKPKDVLIHKDVVLPPITPPHTPPPKTPQSEHMPPVIVEQPDTAPQPIVDNHTVPNPINPRTGDPHGPDIAVPDPGGSPLPEPIIDNTPHKWVSEMPKFPGGNIEDYLSKQISYSAEDIQLGIEGTVFTTFVVERDGSISNVTLLHGISNGPDLNREALRVIAGMPKWIPGKQDGHPVRVQYIIPIHFKLQ